MTRLQHPIFYRQATTIDADLVARTVLAALDLSEERYLDVLQTVLSDTLYSYRNGIILQTSDRRPVGCAICYSGDEYAPLKRRTWDIAWKGMEVPSEQEPSGPSEFYVDSLFIEPEFRGCNYGKQLLTAALYRARELGKASLGLLADSTKPHLVEYYRSAGFRETGSVHIFDHEYFRMTKGVE